MEVTKNQAAPGRFDLIRVFANTYDPETGVDVLRSPEDARAWFEAKGFTGTLPELPGYKELWALRDAVRQALEAHTHAADNAAAWGQIRSYAQTAELRLDVEGPDRIRLTGADTGLAGFVGELLALIYDAIRDGTWERLKLCNEGTCAVAFYDYSKNGSGVWCSMDVCGNRNKARRRRQKAASQGD
jgi:predicted RNA-binding Zn ribbon-like protein